MWASSVSPPTEHLCDELEKDSEFELLSDATEFPVQHFGRIEAV